MLYNYFIEILIVIENINTTNNKKIIKNTTLCDFLLILITYNNISIFAGLCGFQKNIHCNTIFGKPHNNNLIVPLFAKHIYFLLFVSFHHKTSYTEIFS
jgi:hypothetical protein